MVNIYFISLVDKNSINKTINLQNSLFPDKLHINDKYDYKLKNLSKIYKTYEYILSRDDIKSEDIVCIIDGHDVLFNKKLYKTDELKKKFIETNMDMIISSEPNFTHHCHSVKHFFENTFKRPSCYLNSGVIISYKYAYIYIYKDIIDNISKYKSCSKSDQRIISLYMMNNYNNLPVKFTIDDKQIFATTVNISYKGSLEKIKSFFIHVTFLKDHSQNLKYKNLINILES